MKTWQVSYAEKVWHTTQVEANTKEEALTKAYNIITDGEPGEYDTEADGFLGDYNIEEY